MHRYLYLTLAVIAVVGLSAGLAIAWTQAPASPPNNNAPAPINISSTGQYKIGDLIVRGKFTAGTPSNPTTADFYNSLAVRRSSDAGSLEVIALNPPLMGTTFTPGRLSVFGNLEIISWNNSAISNIYLKNGPTSEYGANLIIPDGRLGIGVSAPTTALDVNGTIRLRGGAPGLNKILASDATGLASWKTASELGLGSGGGIAGSGGANYIPRFTDATTIGNSQIFQNGNNIGIATTNANAQLDVNGTFRIRNLTVNTTNTRIMTIDEYGYVTYRDPGTWTGGATGDSNWTLSGTNLYNNNTGNVGIGLSSPGSKLTVNGNIRGMTFQSITGAETGVLTFGSNTNAKVLAPWIDALYFSVSPGKAEGTGSMAFSFGGDGAMTGRKYFLDTNSFRPVNSGSATLGNASTRWGGLFSTSADLSGQITLRGGAPGLNKILASDATGLASWKTASELGLGSGGDFYCSAKFDIDGDLKVTSADSDIVNACVVGSASCTTTYRQRSDLNGDGLVNSVDIQMIINAANYCDPARYGAVYNYLTQADLSGLNLVSGSGTATRIAFWNGTNSLSSNANLYWDNTNSRLGIGTASPTARLHVNGTVRLAGLNTSSNSRILVTDTNGNLSYRDPGEWTSGGGAGIEKIIVTATLGNNVSGIYLSCPDSTWTMISGGINLTFRANKNLASYLQPPELVMSDFSLRSYPTNDNRWYCAGSSAGGYADYNVISGTCYGVCIR